jgi:hypothetical protein
MVQEPDFGALFRHLGRRVTLLAALTWCTDRCGLLCAVLPPVDAREPRVGATADIALTGAQKRPFWIAILPPSNVDVVSEAGS